MADNLWFTGCEMHEASYVSGGLSSASNRYTNRGSKWKRGRGTTANEVVNSTLHMRSYDHATGQTVTYLRTAYIKFDLRIHKYPNANDAGLFDADSSLGGTYCLLKINSDGTLSLYADTQLIGSTAALSLETWYRIELKLVGNSLSNVNPSPPYENDAYAELRIDGTPVIVADMAGTAATNGFNRYNAKCGLFYWGPGTDYAEYPHYDLDDIAVSSAGWIGDCHAIRVFPDGVGTYTDGSATTKWMQACGDNPTTGAGVDSAHSVTLTGAEKASWAFDPTHWNVPAGTPIRAIKLMAVLQRDNVPYDCKIGLRHNGTEYYVDRAGSLAGIARGAIFDDIAGMVAGDSFELIVDAVTGASTIEVYRVGVEVLIENAVESSPAADVQAVVGTYDGTGSTPQLINLGWCPSLVFIAGQSIATPTTAIGIRFAPLENMYYSHLLANSGSDGPSMIPHYLGFGVFGTDSAALNQSGFRYYYIAIKDRTHKVWEVDEVAVVSRTTVDNQDIETKTASDVVEFLWSGVRHYNQNETGTRSVRHNSLLFVGDQAMRMGGAASSLSADYIQSQGTGTFQAGTGLASAGRVIDYLMNKGTARYTNTLLHNYATWTGDGTGARDITVDLRGRTPVLTLIFSNESTFGSRARFASAAAGYAFTLTQSNGAASTSYITGEDTDQISVTSNGNVSGKSYFAIVFAEGTDLDTHTDLSADLLSLEMAIQNVWWPGNVVKQRTYPVQCEQRYFPVEPEDRVFQVPCEQRTFDIEPYCDRTKE